MDELQNYKRLHLYVEWNQLTMIYAASAYGVGRAKDKNQGDFWKHNDISRGITSAWSSYLRSDFGRAYKSLGRQLSDYIKYPIRSLESSDLARSDIGRGYSRLMKWTRSMGDQYLHYLKNPKYALENSDLARSDIGRTVTSCWRGHIRTITNILIQYWHYTQYHAYAIENSDLAKSDLGRAGTHFWKHGCGALIFDLILLLTPGGAKIQAILKGRHILIQIGAKAYSYGSGANYIASCYSSSGGYYGYGGGSFGN